MKIFGYLRARYMQILNTCRNNGYMVAADSIQINVIVMSYLNIFLFSDETASNCKSFLEEDGMNLFLGCFAVGFAR